MDQTRNNMRILKIAVERMRLCEEPCSVAYKLSYSPKTFVGMAEVKWRPNSCLYALRRVENTRYETQEVEKTLLGTDFVCPRAA